MISTSPKSSVQLANDRRNDARQALDADLWLLDRGGAAVRCRCLDASNGGLRLLAPIGFGLRPGQIVELSSSEPKSNTPGATRRAAEVMRTHFQFGGDGDWIELGVRLRGPARADETV
ncbi:MAG: PilZ domain-containing protein [Phycisphaerales bacterium]|nr:PilZ domain-containing protein [Phycisphaerales bacterium]